MEVNKIYCMDNREGLKMLEDNSIDCCVTSPPYWGLRDYGVDGQIGLEQTPEEYVQQVVDVFHEVKRVLKKDGTLWLNLGDSYASGGAGGCSSKSTLTGGGGRYRKGSKLEIMHEERCITRKPSNGLKSKDLVGIPWMVAFALRSDGWYLRQDIIWAKPNPMPESVTDRCTKSHEYIFLLSKSEHYYYDNETIAEDTVYPVGSRPDKKRGEFKGKYHAHEDFKHISDSFRAIRDKRNKRSVWTVATKPFRDDLETSHFQHVEADVVSCGMMRIPSLHCQVHANQDHQDGEYAVEKLNYILHTYNRLLQEQVDGHSGISKQYGQLNLGYNSDCLTLLYLIFAIDHNIENRKTALSLLTNPAYTFSSQIEPHIVYKLKELLTAGSVEHIYESNILPDDLPVHPLVEILFHNVDKFSLPIPPNCICKFYHKVTKKSTHFATFPEELIKPCILAGCPEGGTVLDPFMGAGTTAVVAWKHNRNYLGYELNPEYIEIAEQRLAGTVQQVSMI